MNKDLKLITEKDIPVGNGTINVLVEGHEATIEIYHCTWSDRIRINFKDKHSKEGLNPEWSDSCQSKYYHFDEPGILIIGKDEVRLKIVRA